MEFAVRLCLPVKSEATHNKSQQHDCTNKNVTHKHAKGDGEKLVRSQLHTKNSRQIVKLGGEEVVLPREKHTIDCRGSGGQHLRLCTITPYGLNRLHLGIHRYVQIQ